MQSTYDNTPYNPFIEIISELSMNIRNYTDVAHQIESEIANDWERDRIFYTPLQDSPDFNPNKPPFSVLDFFPFPSGRGLHIGHPLGYIATDVVARKKRMQGFNVLYSMGFDSFGLPTEQYAIETGQHPVVTTEKNIANMRKQLQILGLSHDPGRVFSTTDPDYYKWTQFIFLKMYNSYYDPSETWTTQDGKTVQGRANDIELLKEKLTNGSWVLDPHGSPVSASNAPRYSRNFDPHTDNLDLILNKARLAYLDEVEVMWCPMLGTVLSKEEITPEGVSERGGHPVFKKPLKQWMLRITAYADRLIDDLKFVQWPDATKEMQKNWVGRSHGVEIDFKLEDQSTISIFTTRPETLQGVTAIVVSPKHALAQNFMPTTDEEATLLEELKKNSNVIKRKDSEIIITYKGLNLGVNAINPLTGIQIPVYVSDYIIDDYGSGAVMVVPAHDQRDFEFAIKNNISVIPTYIPTTEWLLENKPHASFSNDPDTLLQEYVAKPVSFKSAYSEKNDDAWINPNIPALDTEDGTPTEIITRFITINNVGKVQDNYRLRDWIFSRQRYWGEPFPIVHDIKTKKTYALDESELPVVLPEISDYAPRISDDNNQTDIEVPLSRANDWKTVTGIVLDNNKVKLVSVENGQTIIEHDGKSYPVIEFQRELNTMPNWAGSSWYYMRYADPQNNTAPISKRIEGYWAGENSEAGWIDLYVGGAEHAVLHLLYARFWHKFMQDVGITSTAEPFDRLYNQGMITGEAYRNASGIYIDVMDVSTTGSGDLRRAFQKSTGDELSIEIGKIGKRYKNGIPPEALVEQYSADIFRLFELYLGPLDKSKPWSSDQIVGMERFCKRIWNLQSKVDFDSAHQNEEFASQLNEALKGISDDIDELKLNTAIASLIKLTAKMGEMDSIPASDFKKFIQALAPFAPFIAEKIYKDIFPASHAECKSIFNSNWPEYDPAIKVDSDLEIPVTINGKRIGSIFAKSTQTDQELAQLAQNDNRLAPYFARASVDKQIDRVVIPRKNDPKAEPRIINFVLVNKLAGG